MKKPELKGLQVAQRDIIDGLVTGADQEPARQHDWRAERVDDDFELFEGGGDGEVRAGVAGGGEYLMLWV